jgi:hypothetical protein
MFVVHFFENNTVVLTQLLRNIPSVDGNIKIKGRKGKVLSIKKMEKNIVHVYVEFEKIIKNQLLSSKDSKKKKQ